MDLAKTINNILDRPEQYSVFIIIFILIIYGIPITIGLFENLKNDPSDFIIKNKNLGFHLKLFSLIWILLAILLIINIII